MSPVEPSDKPTARIAALAFLLALVLVSLLSLWRQHDDMTRLPQDATTQAAAATIRDGWRAGDAIRVVPHWFEQARVGLSGAHFLVGPSLDPWDRNRFQRLWIAWAPHWADTAAAELAWLDTPVVAFDAGGWKVAVGDVRPDPDILWDGFAELERADVARQSPSGDRRRCDNWQHDGWSCGPYNAWFHVGRTWQEMDDRPRECISATVPDRGDAWSIRWRDVPAGGSVRIRAGTTYYAQRVEGGSDVALEVHVNGTRRLVRTFGVTEPGFPEMVVDTADTRGTLELEVRISAADPHNRYFCFRPQTRRAGALAN